MSAEPSPEAVQALDMPRDGVPPVVETGAALAQVVASFAAGAGPVAIDAERASGYRYSQRAYLVQLRRSGAGTALIDPIACPDLSELSAALADAEWVLHAASQDLPCLAELGMRPRRLFDTELAGRLAGLDRVGLGPMVSQLLGLGLEKGYSAADWSTRPLPAAWLVYAALDVEVLVDLRDLLEADLAAQGKLEWAHQEFTHVLAMPAPGARTEPWRRTSGIHALRGRQQLSALRSMWETRDEMARRRDIAPGRILPDKALVAAVRADPPSEQALLALPVFGGRSTRRHVGTWWAALRRGADLPEDQWPTAAPPADGPPPANRWSDRDPAAATRLARARAVMATLSEQHTMPVENLLQPDAVRRLAWSPPEPVEVGAVSAALVALGARPWQVQLCAAPLAEALGDDATQG